MAEEDHNKKSETDSSSPCVSVDKSPEDHALVNEDNKNLNPVAQEVADPANEKISESSYGRDTMLAKVEMEKRLALIKAWEENAKAIVDNKAYKRHSAVGTWESSKRASVEAQLKKFELLITSNTSQVKFHGLCSHQQREPIDLTSSAFQKQTTRQIMLPEIYGKKCFTSKGLIMTVDEDRGLTLTHPFSHCLHIRLPDIMSKFDHSCEYYLRNALTYFFFIQKFLISSSPLSTPKNYIVMVIYGEIGELAYWRPGDKSWNTLKGCQNGRYSDITYYKDKFYAINYQGQIINCDIRDGSDPDDNNIVVAEQVTNMPSEFARDKFEQLYIV
ncbi:hypothetical protein JRO89_XS13G0163700 [Xanthoceras sorbifolium]|uniref:Uncharacterized protein n=1 Tax=Xanthoceras sorbifolium TaxID=99658 RepID=A0ABQ8H8P4_9ROSI|nr:hypothetical protein JRO89_XS13G0163700 [Xanthoceras sorbifolium]